MANTLDIDNAYGRRKLALSKQSGDRPPILFLPGFASHMSGTKANWLADFCAAENYGYVRFDYSGHGNSTGEFEAGTFGLWLDDALNVLDRLVDAPAILVGSSMGGWLMLHLARLRPKRVCGLVGIASAPDFLSRVPARLDAEQQTQLRRHGIVHLPSEYGEPLPITQKMLDDGANWLVLGKPIDVYAPCHLIHGQDDPDVPWTLSVELAAKIVSPHVTVELIKDGDHRLARPSDLERIGLAIRRMAQEYESGEDAN